VRLVSASEVKATDKTSRSAPTITLHNRQRAIRVDLVALQAFARRVLEACHKLPGKKAGELVSLDELNVILVSDRRIAELHHRFLHLRGPTDVITFQHGEIFVSAETARKQARRWGTSLEHELRLYIAHGLLHLHGFDDKTAAAAAEMARVQERLVAAATAERLCIG
jgi:probable rRNA maturation factor